MRILRRLGPARRPRGSHRPPRPHPPGRPLSRLPTNGPQQALLFDCQPESSNRPVPTRRSLLPEGVPVVDYAACWAIPHWAPCTIPRKRDTRRPCVALDDAAPILRTTVIRDSPCQTYPIRVAGTQGPGPGTPVPPNACLAQGHGSPHWPQDAHYGSLQAWTTT